MKRVCLPGGVQRGSGWAMVFTALLGRKGINYNVAERCCRSWTLGQFKLQYLMKYNVRRPDGLNSK